MNGMDNTTHQLHYPVDDATTQGQMPVPTQPGPGSPAAVDPPTTMLSQPTTVAAPAEPASGRYPAPAEPPAWRAEPGPAHARTNPGRGRTTIADEVVERMIQKIVDITVDAVDGVHGLRPGVDQFFGEGFGESLGEGEGARERESAGKGAGKGAGNGKGKDASPGDRAVAVTLTDGQATINIAIEVEFGYAVHDVVHLVRTSVIDSAERLLGLTVAEVNVVVSDVSFDTDGDIDVDTDGGPASAA